MFSDGIQKIIQFSEIVDLLIYLYKKKIHSCSICICRERQTCIKRENIELIFILRMSEQSNHFGSNH